MTCLHGRYWLILTSLSLSPSPYCMLLTCESFAYRLLQHFHIWTGNYLLQCIDHSLFQINGSRRMSLASTDYLGEYISDCRCTRWIFCCQATFDSLEYRSTLMLTSLVFVVWYCLHLLRGKPVEFSYWIKSSINLEVRFCTFFFCCCWCRLHRWMFKFWLGSKWSKSLIGIIGTDHFLSPVALVKLKIRRLYSSVISSSFPGKLKL